ncbi:MAG: hypothetical protein AB1458_08385 [Bacteroidota bacterium]
MSTTESKYSLFKIIDAINDSKKLRDIYSFVSPKADIWDSLTNERKEEIEQALKELNKSLGVSHEKVMAQYKDKYI